MRTTSRRSAALLMPLVALLVTLAAGAAAPIAAQPVTSARGQGAQHEAIPRELALALLNLGPGIGGNTDIRIGEAPLDLPPELIPPGSEILGSMLQFENSVTVLAMPQTPDSAIGVLESHLLAAGWTRPQMPQQRQGGFVGGGPSGQWEMPNVFCHDSAYVTMSSTYRRSSGSLLKVNYNRSMRYPMCRPPQQQQQVYRSPWDEAPMPTLRAPAEARTLGGSSRDIMSGGGGPSAVSTSTRLSTPLKPADVMSHYDRQMRDQGWAPLSDGALEMLAARFYRKKDEKGVDWNASLYSIARPGATEQDVTLRLERR